MSKIYVDEIAPKTSGGSVVITAPQKGQIIEYLSNQCDGSVIEGVSGTYTWPNVTAVQNLTTTYADLTGSVITYTPPEGASRVTYRFEWKWETTGFSGISHYRFYIDSTEVIKAFKNIAASYPSTSDHAEFVQALEHTIHCNAGSNDASAAKFTSWTSPKTLKIQAREYNTSYQARAHQNTWRDGVSASAPFTLAVPNLTIIAVA